MSDTKGDPAQQPPECKINEAPPRCPYIVCTSETMSGEVYACSRCGERYRLYYEDMA